MDSVDMLLAKVTALAKVNGEIIQRINSKPNKITFEYYLTQNPTTAEEKKGCFNIQEVKVNANAVGIVKKWTQNVQLTVIKDIFNDKTDYTCKSFEDLVRINGTMLEVVQKYELFGESDKAKLEISKFLSNFEVIQTKLGEIEEELADSNSQLLQFEEKVKLINDTLVELTKERNIFYCLSSTKDPTACTVPTKPPITVQIYSTSHQHYLEYVPNNLLDQMPLFWASP